MVFGNYNAYQPIGARYNEVQAVVNGGSASTAAHIHCQGR